MRAFVWLAIHSLVWTVLMGIGIVALLVAGIYDGMAILAAIVAGFVLGMPVTWLVARQILAKTTSRG